MSRISEKDSEISDKFDLIKASLSNFSCTLSMKNNEIEVLMLDKNLLKIVLFLKDNQSSLLPCKSPTKLHPAINFSLSCWFPDFALSNNL